LLSMVRCLKEIKSSTIYFSLWLDMHGHLSLFFDKELKILATKIHKIAQIESFINKKLLRKFRGSRDREIMNDELVR
jgi:hypothetical protein